MLNKGNNVKIRAVVIDGTNDQSPTPKAVGDDFTYSYMYTINGKIYKGDTHNEKLKVGDSLWIEYASEHPGFSRPLKENK
jgi:hypothetical protein